MKKILVTVFSLLILSLTSQAQIEVGSNNNVGIGLSGSVNSKLSVNTIGSGYWSAFIENTNTNSGYGGLYVKKAMPGSSGYNGYGIYGLCYAGNGYAYGVRGYAYSSAISTSGRSYGVWGYAGNATTGYNYAVYGRLVGSNNGAGIFGTTSGDTQIDGKYAGYFYGNAKVTGTLTVGATVYTSDENSKKEIKELEKNNLAKLKQVRAIKFKYKTPEEMGNFITLAGDTSNYETNAQMDGFYEKEHIGFLAQELQTVYPSVVAESADGKLGVDYIALIPVLLQAIKEQQENIETLINEVEKLKKKSGNNN